MKKENPRSVIGNLLCVFAIGSLMWAVPLVGYELYSRLDPTNATVTFMSRRLAGKNQFVMLGIVTMLVAIALLDDLVRRRRAPQRFGALKFASIMTLVPWLSTWLSGYTEEHWIARASQVSAMMFVGIVLTHLFSVEVEKLAGSATSEVRRQL